MAWAADTQWMVPFTFRPNEGRWLAIVERPVERVAVEVEPRARTTSSGGISAGVLPLPAGVSGGTLLTATATLGASTSEFSGHVPVDPPDIYGSVFEDLNGDANPADAQPQSGLTVALYRDGGDGQAEQANRNADKGKGNHPADDQRRLQGVEQHNDDGQHDDDGHQPVLPGQYHNHY